MPAVNILSPLKKGTVKTSPELHVGLAPSPAKLMLLTMTSIEHAEGQSKKQAPSCSSSVGLPDKME